MPDGFDSFDSFVLDSNIAMSTKLIENFADQIRSGERPYFTFPLVSSSPIYLTGMYIKLPDTEEDERKLQMILAADDGLILCDNYYVDEKDVLDLTVVISKNVLTGGLRNY